MNNQITKLFILILSSIFLFSSLAVAGGKAKGKNKTKPPGWEQGEKTGWKGEDTPPGLTEEKLEKKQKAGEKGEEAGDKEKEKGEKIKSEADVEAEQAEHKADIEKEKKKREAEKKKEKENYRSMSLMNIDAKILNIPAN